MHIDISEEEKSEMNEFKFPIRIRQAAYCLELMISPFPEDNEGYRFAPLYSSFITAQQLLLQQLNTIVTKLIHSSSISSPQLYKDSLMYYILHYRFHDVLGYSFYVSDNNTAESLLTSGVACPVFCNSVTEFKAMDHLGFEFAETFLELSNLKPSLFDMVKHIAIKTDSANRMEYAISLMLLNRSGMKLSTLLSNLKTNENIEDIIFTCERVLTSNGYKQYCKEKGWDESDCTGEELYFNYAKDYPERIVNILFRPSNAAHVDCLLALERPSEDESNKLSLFMLKVSIKCLIGKDLHLDEGYKSTHHKLFYFDNYKSVSLEKLNRNEDIIVSKALSVPKSYEWWSKNYTEFMKIFNHSLSIIIHPHISLEPKKFNPNYENAAFLCSKEEIEKLLGSGFKEILFSKFLPTLETMDKEKKQK